MRAIVHLDLDAFFCSVELLKDPGLRGKPIVVGGRPERRGVVAAASYPARKYGIHSAMSMYQAQRLCQDLIILPPRFKLYKTYSKIVMGIMRAVSPVFEQVSVDEAYLDLTSLAKNWEEVINQAKKLQLRISRDIGLSASLGVAANKMIAKIASDFEKPAGFTVVNPGEEQSFLAPLPIQKIPGIGPKTAQKLVAMKIQNVGELAKVPEKKLETKFGKIGFKMARWAKGIDNQPVIEQHERKSISQERTFAKDISWEHELLQVLRKLSASVAQLLAKKQVFTRTLSIKIRYADFTTLTRQRSLSQPTNSGELIYQVVKELLRETWERDQPVRLLGVGCSRLGEIGGQLTLELDDSKNTKE